MRQTFQILAIIYTQFIIAQTGIDTKSTNATLEIKSLPTNQQIVDGIITPQVSKATLISKENIYNQDHKGTLLFVNEIDNSTSQKTINITNTGYYYYDGDVWKKFIEPQKYFYLPTFIENISQIGNNFELDIYNKVYKKQLKKENTNQFISNNPYLTNIQIKNDLTEYSNTDFDYVITYYDDTLIEINSISSEGIINYNVISTEVSLSSFINIILIVK